MPLFVILYGLTFFFANWGPNTTTYVIPSESFPTRARATCHGISAASGKLGAVVGGETLGRLATRLGGKNSASGLRVVLAICSVVSMFGAAWTSIFTRDMSGVSLEDLDSGRIFETPEQPAGRDHRTMTQPLLDAEVPAGAAVAVAPEHTRMALNDGDHRNGSGPLGGDGISLPRILDGPDSRGTSGFEE